MPCIIAIDREEIFHWKRTATFLIGARAMTSETADRCRGSDEFRRAREAEVGLEETGPQLDPGGYMSLDPRAMRLEKSAGISVVGVRGFGLFLQSLFESAYGDVRTLVRCFGRRRLRRDLGRFQRWDEHIRRNYETARGYGLLFSVLYLVTSSLIATALAHAAANAFAVYVSRPVIHRYTTRRPMHTAPVPAVRLFDNLCRG